MRFIHLARFVLGGFGGVEGVLQLLFSSDSKDNNNLGN